MEANWIASVASSSESSVSSDSCDGHTIDAAELLAAGSYDASTFGLSERGGSSGDISSHSQGDPPSPEATRLRLRARQLAAALRQQLERQRQLCEQPLRQQTQRRLDAGRLNRRLGEILSRQRDRQAEPQLWVELTVRIRRANAEKLFRDFLAARQLSEQRAAASAGGKAEGGAKARSGGSGSGGSGSNCYGPDCIDSWTRSCRVRASGSCRVCQALLLLLDRVGFPRGRRYRVTVGGFAAADGSGGGGDDDWPRSGRVPEICLMDTVDSLAARRISEIFLAFDGELTKAA